MEALSLAASDSARRSENARLAALTRWSRTADSQAARDGLRARYDPGPDIPEPRRSRMIEAGMQAHMLRMRRARKAAGDVH